MRRTPISRSLWRIALLCALVVACGKYGPPRRVHDAPRATSVEVSETRPAEVAPAPGDDEENTP